VDPAAQPHSEEGLPLRLEVRSQVVAKRPIASADDLHFLCLAPFLFVSALLVPERHWPKAAARIQKLADILRPQSAAAELPEAAAAAGFDPKLLAKAINRSRAGRTEHLIHCLNALIRRQWSPPIEIEGKQHLDQALAGGKGAILWVAHFCFSSLFTKMGLAKAGYRVSHISRPEHGVSKSRLGIALLNPVRSVAENRFLEGRIVHDRSVPAATKVRAIDVLRRNGIVSVTVGAWEGRQVAIGPLLSGEFQIAVGAPALAFASGAPLLPVFTVRAPNSAYRIALGRPIGPSARESLESFLLTSSEQLIKQHERFIRSAPSQWRGWKDWLKGRKTKPNMQVATDAEITFVLTSCGRFDLLEETLSTFFAQNTAPIGRYVLIEDSGDKAVRKVAARFPFPLEVIVNKGSLGQIASIDKAYATVTTPYVFHCEDDWRFFRPGFIEESLVLLQHDPAISVVCSRRLENQRQSLVEVLDSPLLTNQGVAYRKADPWRNRRWHGYTFNPGLRRMSDYRMIGSFKRWGNEGDASLFFKRKGMVVAYLADPACETTGAERRLPKQTEIRSARSRWQRQWSHRRFRYYQSQRSG
jgi:lauroyl/myristoyl acyltransferase